MPRLLAITYGAVTVGNGGNASAYLVDKYRFASSYVEARIDFEVVVSHATRATFLAAEAALVAEYRKPDQAVSLVLGASTRHAYNPADGTNTALRTSASCRKLGRDDDTANSARYECSIICALPADLSGRAGRREASISYQRGPSGRGSAAFAGVYTALTANSARAQYESAATTWIAGALATLDGAWKLAAEQYDFDDLNKILRFSRVYEDEMLESYGLDTSALRNQRMAVRRSNPSANFAPGFDTRPIAFAFVDYSTNVDRAVSTNLPEVYATTVRPLILTHVSQIVGGSLVIQREEPGYDPADNRISVSMALQIDSGAQFISSRLEVSDTIDPGLVFLPVWSGDPFDRDEHHAPITQVRRYRRTTTGRPGMALSDKGINPPQGYREVGRSLTRSPFRLGTPGGGSIELEGVTLEIAFIKVNTPGRSRQSGGLSFIPAMPSFGGGAGSNPFPVAI
ncbi:MAG: hypothetical protein KF878_09855 [Planctomycetes bacterium]|nr:hypothetical protein [Planctomycetota bacterium]